MDRLQIMNLVLSKLGEDEELDDPQADTKAARAIRSYWDATRDMVLRAHLWNFAIDPAGAALSADAAYSPAREADHPYRYALPNDFLRLDLQRLRPPGLRRDLRVGGRWLYAWTGGGEVQVSYVRRVEEPGAWDPLFAEAFACRLAAQITQRLTGGDPSRAELMREYQLALAEAKAVDGRENPPEELEETDWVTARYDSAPGAIVY